MEYLFILFVLLLFVLFLYFVYKVLLWIFRSKASRISAITLITILCITLIINKLFFQKMEFTQSHVYSNLYIVKHPAKDNETVKKAVLNKIKEYLIANHKTGNKLSYSSETNCIYFYEDGGRTFGFIGDAGTSYFIDHEEDLGGFVSEELGMYQEYRITEFYYEKSATKLNTICGELNWFEEGSFVKTDTICNLKISY